MQLHNYVHENMMLFMEAWSSSQESLGKFSGYDNQFWKIRYSCRSLRIWDERLSLCFSMIFILLQFSLPGHHEPGSINCPKIKFEIFLNAVSNYSPVRINQLNGVILDAAIKFCKPYFSVWSCANSLLLMWFFVYFWGV